MDLNVSFTPTVHAVFLHADDFCENSLGFYSKQAMESAYFDFKRMWSKYNVSRKHPKYVSR